MDINTALITGAGTILCGVLVAIIFIFGFKEKTFEEALDEQRRGELLELIRGDKGRPKKPKKASKKTKEKSTDSKQTAKEKETSSDSAEKPAHVGFKFPEAEVVSEHPPNAPLPQDESRKKRNKREKVRPILHNKEEQSPVADNVELPPPANHFDEIQPKDDVLLKRSHSREDISSPSSDDVTSEPEVTKPEEIKIAKPEKKPATTKVNGTKPPAGKVALNTDAKLVGKLALSTPVVPVVQQIPIVAPAIVPVQVPTQAAAPLPTAVPASVAMKDRKKKKGDLATLQQVINKAAEGVTMNLLAPLVRKAELSHSEVHQLIEQLLNREQGGGHEWVEGRQDPVARLKKQLADKERALAEEQQGLQAVQAKLIEVRAELNGERQRVGQAQRQFDEQLAAKQHELQTALTRLQLANETHTKTLATAQQVQTQLAEEKKNARKLLEEHTAIKNSMKQEIELHVQASNKLHQEEVSSLQGQIAGMQSQLAELQSRLQEQQGDQDKVDSKLAASQEAVRKAEKECNHLRQQMASLEEQLNKVNSLAAGKDSELGKATRLQKELSDRVQSLESDLKSAKKQADDLSAQLKLAQSSAAPIVPDLSGKVSQLETIINTKDALVTKLQAENEEQKKTVFQLQSDLDMQREKNDELRKKNWMAMEAATSAEKKLEGKQKEIDRLAKSSKPYESIQQEEQNAMRELLQRIFPSVPCPDTKDHKAWMEKFESAAQQWLANEMSAEHHQISSSAQDDSTQHVLVEVEKQNSQLQGMVTHYKSIIEDTEGMLNKLERHVEQEEARWRRQLQLKEEELEGVTAERDTLRSEMTQGEQQTQESDKAQELETALSVLQDKLRSEEKMRSASESHAQQLQSRLDEIAVQVMVLEQAKEERDNLALQLAKESNHSQQLAQQVKELEETLAQRGGSNHLDTSKAKDQSNATTNGPSHEPSISEIRPLKRRRLTEWFRKKVSPRKRRNTISTPESPRSTAD